MNLINKPTNLNLPNNPKDFNINSKNSIINSKDSNINSKDSNINSKNSDINSKDSNINSKDSNIDAKESNINPLDSIQKIIELESYEYLDNALHGLTKLNATMKSILDSVKQIDKKHTGTNDAIKKLIDTLLLDINKRKAELSELKELLMEKSKEPSFLALNLMKKTLWSNFSLQNLIPFFFFINGLVYLCIHLFGQ